MTRPAGVLRAILRRRRGVSPVLAALCLAVSAAGSRAQPGRDQTPTTEVHWPMRLIDGSLRGADGVRSGDLNGDGLDDYVTGWEESGVTRVYFHPGRDAVSKPWPYVELGPTPKVEDAFFADLDSDGRLDIVICCEAGPNRVLVYWGPGPHDDLRRAEAWRGGSIPAVQGLGGWMYGVAEQIDGRHGADLFLGCKAKGGGTAPAVGWLEAPANPRDLAGWKWHPLHKAEFVRSMAVHDMDGDGDADLLVNDFPNGPWPEGWKGLYWLERPEDIHRPWPRHDLSGRAAIFFAVGDIDGDGTAEIAWGGREAVVLRRAEQGRWVGREQTSPRTVKLARSSALRDIDGDGHAELVCMGVPHHIWHFDGSMDPRRWRVELIANTVGIKPDRAELADLDLDGDLDIVSCEELHQGRGVGVFWLENPAKP